MTTKLNRVEKNSSSSSFSTPLSLSSVLQNLTTLSLTSLLGLPYWLNYVSNPRSELRKSISRTSDTLCFAELSEPRSELAGEREVIEMDADSWSSRISSASRRYQSAFQSRSDMFMAFEEIDGDDDLREEFPCPFCSEYFDIVGLCCHIDDEHPMEAKNGVCPVCALRVGIDMVAHITMQHGNIFKMQRKRKCRKAGSHSTLSVLRKELREGNLQSLFGASSCIGSSANSVPDPLLSSFILPMADDFVGIHNQLSTKTSSTKKSSDAKKSERKVQSSPLSVKDQEEKAKRCEFVQGLMLSTILDDIL